MKGCGKSAPGVWRQAPHGKPHPEQDRIGVSCLLGRNISFRETRVGCLSAREQSPAEMNGCHRSADVEAYRLRDRTRLTGPPAPSGVYVAIGTTESRFQLGTLDTDDTGFAFDGGEVAPLFAFEHKCGQPPA